VGQQRSDFLIVAEYGWWQFCEETRSFSTIMAELERKGYFELAREMVRMCEQHRNDTTSHDLLHFCTSTRTCTIRLLVRPIHMREHSSRILLVHQIVQIILLWG
jgi:hypothetical protein